MIAGTLVDEKYLWTAPNIEPRCKNCRFWMKARNGLCEKFEYSEAWTIDSNFASASYDDSGVHTGSEFGCVHFEVKDGKEN